MIRPRPGNPFVKGPALLLALLASFLSLSAFADCVTPPAPTLPQGATASRDEMLAGQQAIKAYKAAIDRYVNCADTSGDELSAARAMRGLREIADRFNEELRAFKVKNGA